MSKIEFVIPTYERTDHLMCIINSIYAQRSDKWKIHVVADCPPEGQLNKVMKYFEGDDRIKFTITDKRYNDWGHTPRNIGVQMATEDWVVMTGEDNYYVPVFVDHFLAEVTNDTHFIYCDMIHNWVNSEYAYIPAEPVYGRIDIGNFASRTELAKQIPLQTKIVHADFLFVDEYLKKFPTGKLKYIKKPLYVHN
jgi:glycosyltransferase involved in cell wall biosynthesis